MRNFVWGALVGAVVMYLYVTGLDALYQRAADLWADASSPPAGTQRRAPP
ncbi:MAG TPA: hypothetical protein VGR62_22480 [Candidatus Binatia bacterium]|jgi:hypothetical protein|nr:hypothetical protein [Candidatus Binatia bacterium]